MKKKLFICQAPADVKYILSLIPLDALKEISILVVKVSGIYKFFRSLSIFKHVDINFVPYEEFTITKPLNIVKGKRNLKFKVKEIESNLEYRCEIIFFSRFADWITASLVHYFYKTQKYSITYVDHYDSISAKEMTYYNILPFKRIKSFFLLWYLSSVRLKLNVKQRYSEFPIKRYPKIKHILTIEVDRKRIEKFSYEPQGTDNLKNRILLFTSYSDDFIESKQTFYVFEQTIRLLKNAGYSIYFKGHPRLGIIKELETYPDVVIPEYIPGEFINYNNFSGIIGILSSLLSYCAKNYTVPVISLLELATFKKEEDKVFFRNFLNNQSSEKILFTADYNSIEKYLKQPV